MATLRKYALAPARVVEHYRLMRTNQTMEYNLRMRSYIPTYNITITEALDTLGRCSDSSDPDVEGDNLMHAYQTAERMRAAGEPTWMQLTGLIHDLGKIQMLRGRCDDGQSDQSQWGITGDTWAVGCAIPDCIVYPEFNRFNADMGHPVYSTEKGAYEQSCGIRNMMFAWGHDEYMYRVLLRKRSQMIADGASVVLPTEALDCVRFHSAYPWHTGGAYKWAESKGDKELKELILRFNAYDLYSKDDKPCDIERLRPYYEALIATFLPGQVLF